MSNPESQIQELLDIYAARKNAQGGQVNFTSLKLLSISETQTRVEIEGINEGLKQPFTSGEKGILARRIFAALSFENKDDVIGVFGSLAQIRSELIRSMDNIALYPHTEQFQKIMSKLGAHTSDEEGDAYILAYPHEGKALSQFARCPMRGFYIRSDKLIDPSLPERGVVVELPYERSSLISRRNVNIALVALSNMGLRVAVSDSSIENSQRALFNGHRPLFPDLDVPVDGEIGFTTLTSNKSGALRLTIMEEENVVAARLAEYADKEPVFKLPQPAPRLAMTFGA